MKMFLASDKSIYIFFSGDTQLLQQQINRKQYTFRINEAAFKVY